MKVLITGASGQLGYSLQKTVPIDKGIELIALTRAQLDLAQPENIHAILSQYNPDIIINAAAYTAVDKAESEADLAYIINAEAVRELARWAHENQKVLIQVSTDFVFDGAQSMPYKVGDTPNPIGIYGQSKLQGEIFALSHSNASYVVRTGWVYCEQGANFVKTILRLAKERDSLSIVVDQVGTPTYAIHLAEFLWQLALKKPQEKVWHFSDAGAISWYDFAVAIVEDANHFGLLSANPLLKPIPATQYPTPAKRPSFSVLNKQVTWEKFDIAPEHWRVALRKMLKALS